MKKRNQVEHGAEPNLNPDSQSAMTPDEMALIANLLDKHLVIQAFLVSIASEAKTSKERFALLLKVAYQSTKALTVISKYNPEWANNLAKQMIVWPVLASIPKKERQELYDYLKSLGLGQALFSQVHLDKFKRTKTPAREWAVRAIETIATYRGDDMPEYPDSFERNSRMFFQHPPMLFNEPTAVDLSKGIQDRGEEDSTTKAMEFAEWERTFEIACTKLPRLSKGSVKKWVPVVRMYIMRVANGRPERHPLLKEIGNYRENHYVSTRTEKQLKKESAALKSSDSNRRDGIFTQINRALKAIAKEC